MYVTRKWSGESSTRGNAVPLVPLLSQATEEGPANQSGLTLEVESKHFKNRSFYKSNRTPEIPIASYKEKFSVSIDTKQQANNLLNHEIAKFDLQFFFANAN